VQVIFFLSTNWHRLLSLERSAQREISMSAFLLYAGPTTMLALWGSVAVLVGYEMYEMYKDIRRY